MRHRPCFEMCVLHYVMCKLFILTGGIFCYLKQRASLSLAYKQQTKCYDLIAFMKFMDRNCKFFHL